MAAWLQWFSGSGQSAVEQSPPSSWSVTNLFHQQFSYDWLATDLWWDGDSSAIDRQQIAACTDGLQKICSASLRKKLFSHPDIMVRRESQKRLAILVNTFYISEGHMED